MTTKFCGSFHNLQSRTFHQGGDPRLVGTFSKHSENVHEVLLPPLLISNVVVQLLSQCQDPDYRPVLAIHHKLRRDNMHIYDELSTDKFFR